MIRSEHSSWIEQCLGLHQLHFWKNKFICLILICNCTVLPTAPMKWKKWLFFISLLALFDRGSVEHSNICLAQLSKTLEAWALPLLRSIGHNHLVATVPVHFRRVNGMGNLQNLAGSLSSAKWFPKSWGILNHPESRCPQVSALAHRRPTKSCMAPLLGSKLQWNDFLHQSQCYFYTPTSSLPKRTTWHHLVSTTRLKHQHTSWDETTSQKSDTTSIA